MYTQSEVVNDETHNACASADFNHFTSNQMILSNTMTQNATR